MAIFVLDACAVIALLRGEAGHEAITEAVRSRRCHIHAVNLCEVYYDCVRVGGEADADGAMRDCRRMQLIVANVITPRQLRAAGMLKVRFRLSLADCFAAALANQLGAPLLTSDHKEFSPLVEREACKVEFFR